MARAALQSRTITPAPLLLKTEPVESCSSGDRNQYPSLAERKTVNREEKEDRREGFLSCVLREPGYRGAFRFARIDLLRSRKRYRHRKDVEMSARSSDSHRFRAAPSPQQQQWFAAQRYDDVVRRWFSETGKVLRENPALAKPASFSPVHNNSMHVLYLHYACTSRI